MAQDCTRPRPARPWHDLQQRGSSAYPLCPFLSGEMRLTPAWTRSQFAGGACCAHASHRPPKLESYCTSAMARLVLQCGRRSHRARCSGVSCVRIQASRQCACSACSQQGNVTGTSLLPPIPLAFLTSTGRRQHAHVFMSASAVDAVPCCAKLGARRVRAPFLRAVLFEATISFQADQDCSYWDAQLFVSTVVFQA